MDIRVHRLDQQVRSLSSLVKVSLVIAVFILYQCSTPVQAQVEVRSAKSNQFSSLLGVFIADRVQSGLRFSLAQLGLENGIIPHG